MYRTVPALCATSLLVGAWLSAQTVPKKTSEQLSAAYDAHRADFDYLLGDWEFSADNRQYGKSHGFWSAVRLAEGQVLDEYRLVGDSGESFYATTTIRSYNAVLDRWELIGMDQGNGLQDFGTAQRVGREMHLEQKFGVMSSEPSTWRIRYFNIQPGRFSWTADRSTDGGRTWTERFMQIEARRIGPARALGPLAVSKGRG
jgi:hypothetical protein